MRTLKLLLLGLLAFGPLASAWADLVVVTNPKSGIDRMSREEVVFVFLGRWRQLPSGIAAVPIDLPIDSPERAAFYRQLVSKSPSEIKAYWSRLMFSGGARPPDLARQPRRADPDSRVDPRRHRLSGPFGGR